MKAINIAVSGSLPSVPVAALVGHDGPVQAVEFTADGKYCLTASVDRTVRLWNPSRLDPAFPPPPGENDNQVDIPLEKLPRALPIQDYTDGLTHPVSAIAVDKESSTTLASACDKTLVITDLVTKQAVRRIGGHLGRINAVAVGENAHTYLTASYDATTRVWDGRSKSSQPIQIFREAKDSVTAVHVDSEEALIRTASVDGVVRTYDLRRGVVRCDDVGSPVTSIALTKDSQCLVVSCLDGTIRLEELESGELLNTYNSNHIAGQYGLKCCVSADDATIVSGSEDGKTVLYDLVKATCVQSLTGPVKPTCAVAAHPKESHVIVSASYDGSTVVWGNSPEYMGWR